MRYEEFFVIKKKAFDTMSQDILFNKLEWYGKWGIGRHFRSWLIYVHHV